MAHASHPFLPATEQDREEMLAAVGVASADELFAQIPEAVRFRRELDLEPPLSEPEVVNDDPYGEGWLVRIRLTDPAEVDSLLDADAYRKTLEEQ